MQQLAISISNHAFPTLLLLKRKIMTETCQYHFQHERGTMNLLSSLLYALCLALIRAFKVVEHYALKPFTPVLQRLGKTLGESVGVVFHCPGEREWGQEDEERVLAACEYDKLVHIDVRDSSYFLRMCNACTLASGETFMEGVWDSREGLDGVREYVRRVLENNLLNLYWDRWWNRLAEWVELCAFNLQSPQRAFIVGKEHYDMGNDLYEGMLDPWMQYTCGYWAQADNLNDAQLYKIELTAKKLDLKKGMRVLDIGCGFGTLCKYLALNYGVECLGVTISEEQARYARDKCKGLEVEIRIVDYREIDDTFDRIVSVGMFEHVGFHNYNTFFQVVHRCLKPDGIFLLHTIGRANLPRSELFFHHYIFPNGNLPSVRDIAESVDGLFVLEDWHCFAADYSRTLDAWRRNFLESWKANPALRLKYGERFYRMWTFYLAMSSGAFQARKLQLWQLVLSKDGLKGDYYRAAW